MNTSQLIAATSNIKYPSCHGMNRDEKVAAHGEYYESITALQAEWKLWLAAEYAGDLNQKARDAIYAKAWSDGHSSGYSEIEYHYIELAELVRTAL